MTCDEMTGSRHSGRCGASHIGHIRQIDMEHLFKRSPEWHTGYQRRTIQIIKDSSNTQMMRKTRDMVRCRQMDAVADPEFHNGGGRSRGGVWGRAVPPPQKKIEFLPENGGF